MSRRTVPMENEKSKQLLRVQSAHSTLTRRKSKKSIAGAVAQLSASDRSLRRAIKVGNYILLKNIGKGSSCEVKLAQHVETGDIVAVKIISKEWILKNDKDKDIKNEIAVMSTLKHPNIVELKEVMNSEAAIYMVMEYVDGEELLTVIQKSKAIDEVTAQGYFEQIVEALFYMHSSGVAHRDIKPENILVNKDGRIKLTDFGFSMKCVKSARTPLASEDSMCGTPHYTAPEVFSFNKQSTYDPRCSDIWSAGIVLFTMLAGRLPFEGSSMIHALELICTEHVRFPPHFSKDVCDLLSDMLDKDIDSRISIIDVIHHDWLRPKDSFADEQNNKSLKLTELSEFKKNNPFFSNAKNDAMYSPMSSFCSTFYSSSPRSPISSPSPLRNSSDHLKLAKCSSMSELTSRVLEKPKEALDS